MRKNILPCIYAWFYSVLVSFDDESLVSLPNNSVWNLVRTESSTIHSANKPIKHPMPANTSKLHHPEKSIESIPFPFLRPRSTTVNNAREPKMPA